jgi:hypothetical protein
MRDCFGKSWTLSGNSSAQVTLSLGSQAVQKAANDKFSVKAYIKV